MTTKHVIDCNANPIIPDGLRSIEEHIKGGQLEWDPDKIRLYRSDYQNTDTGFVEFEDRPYPLGRIRSDHLRQPILNANVLDYLLEHPELIPEEWKGKSIFFWGTIYCESQRSFRVVRCLHWRKDPGKWRGSWMWIDNCMRFTNVLRRWKQEHIFSAIRCS